MAEQRDVLRRRVERLFFVQAGEPGLPAARPPDGLKKGLCIVCAGETYPSVHTSAPRLNALNIESASRLAAMLPRINLAKSPALSAWYALIPQARTLAEFLAEDRCGGFWTSLGIICRACSGMPGVDLDWRSETWVARCMCMWERRHPAVPEEALLPTPDGRPRRRYYTGERIAERSLRAHIARKHPGLRRGAT